MSVGQTTRVLLRHLCGAIDPEGTDSDLLDRFVRNRDGGAFAALVARHGPMVLGVCRRLLNDPHDAEDAFQATFIVLARKADTLGREDPVGAWLHGVACRTAAHARADRARRTVRERRATAMPVAEPTPPLLWEELRPVLDEEVRGLPNKYRVPVILCYLDGKTYDEAAREIGCPKGTVATRLARARDLLRERLSARGVTLSATGVVAGLADGARAAVPTPLLTATVEAATSVAAAPAVAALSEGVLKAMAGPKLKVVTALLVASVIATGAAAIAYQAATQATEPPAGGERAPEQPAATSPQPAGWIRVTVGREAFLFRPDGTGRSETAVPTVGKQPSPDGKSVLEIRTAEWGSEVVVTDVDGKNARRVSTKAAKAERPCWSPDGNRVAFLAQHDGVMQVHVADRDGGNLQRLSDGPHGAAAPRFAPNGQLAYLLLGKREGKRQPADLVVTEVALRVYSKIEDPAKPLPLDSPGPTGTLVKDVPVTEYAWSPDGQVIAYGKPAAIVFHEVRTGKAHEVDLKAIDAKLADHAAVEIAWSPDGRAVACRLVFWGGRQANGPKMLGGQEAFIIPRSGKPSWFAVGGEPRRVEWLRDRPPAAVDIRMPDGTVAIAADQIVSYDWATHTLTLAPKVREELARRLRTGDLTVPGPNGPRSRLVGGAAFSVCVDGKPAYAARFTTIVSSIPIAGPVAVIDEQHLDPALGADQLRIKITYPGPPAAGADDPRADRRVREALAAAGKLKGEKPENRPSAPDAGDGKTVLATGPWSEAVDGVRGRLIIALGRTKADGKTRESLAYVELEHVQDARFREVDVHFDPDALKCELTDASGKAVPQTPVFGSGGRPGKTWVTLPYDSSVRLRANPYGHGREGGMYVSLCTSAWHLTDKAEYHLSGTLEVKAPDGHGRRNVWTGTLKFPAAKLQDSATPRPSVTDEASGISFAVKEDGRTVVARGRDGNVVWEADVIKTAGNPSVGDPVIRGLLLKEGKLTAVYGKHSSATFEMTTGKLLGTGSD